CAWTNSTKESITTRAMRENCRQREQLKRELQRIAAQGRGLLLSQGCRQRKSWWQEPLWERLKGQLPGWLVERLEVFRRVLEGLQPELEAATRALEEAAPAQLPKGPAVFRRFRWARRLGIRAFHG